MYQIQSGQTANDSSCCSCVWNYYFAKERSFRPVWLLTSSLRIDFLCKTLSYLLLSNFSLRGKRTCRRCFSVVIEGSQHICCFVSKSLSKFVSTRPLLDSLQRSPRREQGTQRFASSYTAPVHPPPSVFMPSHEGGDRLSPGSLDSRLTAELNKLEYMEESVRQLTDVERTRAVSLAQQETVSLAQILKVIISCSDNWSVSSLHGIWRLFLRWFWHLRPQW